MASLNREQLTQQYWDLRQIFAFLGRRKTAEAKILQRKVRAMAEQVEGCVGQLDSCPANEWKI